MSDTLINISTNVLGTFVLFIFFFDYYMFKLSVSEFLIGVIVGVFLIGFKVEFNDK